MRDIPDPGFSGDDGAADPALREALQAAATGGPSGPVLALLLQSRVLVPVVAVPGGTEHDERGLVRDTSSQMAAVLMTGRDGRRALLAFSGGDALTAWDPGARPVPMPVRRAAEAALSEDAAALVLDVAGPAMFVLQGDDLRHAAAGSVLVRVAEGYGWARGDADGTTGPV